VIDRGQPVAAVDDLRCFDDFDQHIAFETLIEQFCPTFDVAADAARQRMVGQRVVPAEHQHLGICIDVPKLLRTTACRAPPPTKFTEKIFSRAAATRTGHESWRDAAAVTGKIGVRDRWPRNWLDWTPLSR